MSAILTNLDTWLNSLSKKVNSELHNLVAGIFFIYFPALRHNRDRAGIILDRVPFGKKVVAVINRKLNIHRVLDKGLFMLDICGLIIDI